MIVTQEEVKSQRELDELRLLMQLYDEHGNAVLRRVNRTTPTPFASYLQEKIGETIDVIRSERAGGGD